MGREPERKESRHARLERQAGRGKESRAAKGQLAAGIAREDRALIELAARRGASLEEEIAEGVTALEWAALAGKAEAAAKPDASGEGRGRARAGARERRRRAAMIRDLLARAARRLRGEAGESAREKANREWARRREMADRELEAEMREHEPRRELFFAIEQGDRAEAARLLDSCPRLLEWAEPSGKTPLLMAALTGEREIALDLLERGANAQARDRMGWGALRGAAAADAAELVEDLARRGLWADGEERWEGPAPEPDDEWEASYPKKSVGAMAAREGRLRALEALCRLGWRWEEEDRKGWRPESEALLERLRLEESAPEAAKAGARRGL